VDSSKTTPEGKAVLPADRESRCGRYRASIMTSKGGKMTSKAENNDNNDNRNKIEPESKGKGTDHGPPTKGQRATTKGEQRRGRGPISDSQADGRLKQLRAFIENVTCKRERAERPNARKNGAWETPTPKSAGVKLVEFVR
ncbi:unnamed protein product, partial [Ectocarpus sp. 12 AP-2014]